MGLFVGMFIEVIAIASLLYFTRKYKNVYFRTLGVAVFAFVIAFAIYGVSAALGLLDSQSTSVARTFIMFWTVFGIAIGGLIFWASESKKNLKDKY